MVYKRFAKNIDKAREVFESLIDYFRNDYHFWLQYGSLELEGAGGNMELADNYLNQAASIKPNSVFVKNALANLYYKKALQASSKSEADRLKEDADQILIGVIKDKYSSDPYTYHIYGRGYYNWILHWLSGPENVRKALQELQKVVKEGCDFYPNNKRLKELKEVVAKAILMTAVNADDIRYPILYSEFES
jgi:tetratricopeptide (TPR) repeat protein